MTALPPTTNPQPDSGNTLDWLLDKSPFWLGGGQVSKSEFTLLSDALTNSTVRLRVFEQLNALQRAARSSRVRNLIERVIDKVTLLLEMPNLPAQVVMEVGNFLMKIQQQDADYVRMIVSESQPASASAAIAAESADDADADDDKLSASHINLLPPDRRELLRNLMDSLVIPDDDKPAATTIVDTTNNGD